MTPDPPILERVDRVKLTNFRGWGGEHEVVFAAGEGGSGADVVLVTSANGRGKSSLLEGLARVLNGRSFHDDEANTTRGVEAAWSLSVRAGEREIGHEDGTWAARLDSDRSDVPEPGVLRRATVFLQERLGEQFEGPDAGGGDTLLSFVAPFPPWLETYRKALGRLAHRWMLDEPSEPPAAEVASAIRRRDQAAEELVAAASPLLPAGSPLTGSPMERLSALVAQATGRSADAADPAAWMQDLRKWLRARSRASEAHRRRVAEAARRVDEARRALQEHLAAWPELLQLVAWARGVVDLDRVLDLVHGLAERPKRWEDPAAVLKRLAALPAPSRVQVPLPDEVLSELAGELSRVDRARAARYRENVVAWKEFWDERERERADRERALAAAEEELAGLESDVLLARADETLERLERATEVLRRAEQRREEARRRRVRWEALQPRLEVIRRQQSLLARLREQQLDEGVAAGVRASMEAVMRHFVVAGVARGQPTVEVDVEPGRRSIRPRLADGRDLELHASTGQKAQLALAWLLGTNALIQRWLPHRVLLLDDVSTALDLTNLAAECALLRKFAYTRNQARRRQVVVASHHDQLTHRMFDLLLPPEGFTLREIRLVDWHPRNGPEVKASTIRPTRAATDETREKLGQGLGRAFTPVRLARSGAG